VSPAIIEHIGRKLYGSLTDTLVELISNAWDADADEVLIELPREMGPGAAVVVEDNGTGMESDDIKESFLYVGTDRRHKKCETAKGRRPIGRKGIGRLSCFARADTVVVNTRKSGWEIEFELNYDRITSGEVPQTDMVVTRSVKPTDDPNEHGTTITITDLAYERAPKIDQITESISRRFTFGDEMVVYINGSRVEFIKVREALDEESIEEINEEIEGVGRVMGFVGWSDKPLRIQPGFDIVVRERVVAKSWFFDMAGTGIKGQLSRSYIGGVLHVEAFDTEDLDAISTDRQSLREDLEQTRAFVDWGQDLVKRLASKFVDTRTRRKKVSWLQRKDFRARFNGLTPQSKTVVRSLVSRLYDEMADSMDEDIDLIIDLILRAFESSDIMAFLKRVAEEPEEGISKMLEILGDWSLLEVGHIAQITKGRLQVVDTMRSLLDDEETTEFPNMQEFIEKNYWILDPRWFLLQANRAIATLVRETYDGKHPRVRGDLKRPDFVCLEGSGKHVLVEIKGPDHRGDTDDYTQLMEYREILAEVGGEDKSQIECHLVCYTHDAILKETAESTPFFHLHTWNGLWDGARRILHDYLKKLEELRGIPSGGTLPMESVEAAASRGEAKSAEGADHIVKESD